MLGTHREGGDMEQDLNQALALRIKERFLEELRGVNDNSARFGLRLSEQGMQELAQGTHPCADRQWSRGAWRERGEKYRRRVL